MTLIAYKEQKFVSKTLAMIEQANSIIQDYQAQGYQLTLRQLYYQFVSINYFPNSEKSYNRLGETISNARLAGLISWDAIQDKTRNIQKNPHWNSAVDFMASVVPQFAMDMWENQETYVEVWVEKDALIGVVERPCEKWDVNFMACRGYMSQSEEWQAANRFEEANDNGKTPILIYLGDHDPSGIDMSRDHNSRLNMFLNHTGIDIEVRRIALNYDQVRAYNPPPNPTKITDSRSPDYIKKFGGECWELDALKPSVIDQLVTDAIQDYRDPELWEEQLEVVKEQREKLEKAYRNIRDDFEER